MMPEKEELPLRLDYQAAEAAVMADRSICTSRLAGLVVGSYYRLW